MMMVETAEALQFEVRRLREIVEKQYLELAWQQAELTHRGGKAVVVRFGAGDLAKTTLTGNAGLLTETREPPPAEFWPQGPVPTVPLTPNCGFASYASGREQLKAIGVSICGLDEAAVEHIVSMVETRLRKARNFRPVFLMDITRTEIFRRRGFAYEYLAPCSDREQRLAGRLQAFNAKRLTLLARKWGFAGIINFGSRATTGRRTQIAVNSAVDEIVNLHSVNGSGRQAARA
jgi:hypothetical protein